MANEEQYLHILAGDGPDWLYEQKTRFDLLLTLAPPAELLSALERQAQRGTLPEATATWAAKWQAIRGKVNV